MAGINLQLGKIAVPASGIAQRNVQESIFKIEYAVPASRGFANVKVFKGESIWRVNADPLWKVRLGGKYESQQAVFIS